MSTVADIERTLNDGGAPSKGHISSGLCPPPPGPGLADAVYGGEDAGLPVWFVPLAAGGYLQVPRLVAVPTIRRGRPVLVTPGVVSFGRHFAARVAETGECEFDGEVLAALEGRPGCVSAGVLDALSAPTPLQVVSAGRRALAEPTPALRRMAASLLRDLHALTYKSVAAELGITGADEQRAAQRDVTDGRELWRQVPGAWPWWVLPDGLPREWWRKQDVVAAWRAWRGRLDS